jgi:hypothetical protein
MLRDRLTIVFSGMLAGVPGQGGATWAALQYVLGLRQLGHTVYVVEPVAGATQASSAYFRAVVRAFGLADHAALLVAGTRKTVGLPFERLLSAARDADLLINVAGMLTDPLLQETIPTRLYLDLDPGFTQLWDTCQGVDMRFANHTHFATVGVLLGRLDCRVPACGRQWLPTLQPVVLACWPASPPARISRLETFTTIGHWRSYGSIEHDGVHYGQKAHSLRPLFNLPARTGAAFELALGIHPTEERDLAELAAHGWRLVDPDRVAGSPARYRRYIQESWAEFGLAKSGYVAGRTGWFADRSVCYLASGRPVVAQDTGFDAVLPTGHGLFRFQTAEDVAEAYQALRSDYKHHARAALAIAEGYFDSRRVLPQLLAALA